MSGKITASSHLSEEQLRAFQAGALAEEHIAEAEAHLQSCLACCDALSRLPEDSFLLRVRCACRNAPTLLQQGPSCTPPPQDTFTLPETPLETTASAAPSLPGYEDMRELGRGGMGIVYAAKHVVMGRWVAIKVIHPELSSNPVAADRFRREVLAAARLSHPNIVTAYDAGENGGRTFLVMEHIDGESLGDRLNRFGPLPIAEACEAVRQAALGVQHAHNHGLIHRDLKPHNLMRTADGTVKVCDFGLAFLISDHGVTSRATAANAIMGTPDYMAPEQAEDARSVDGRTDVYALGCTLYHLLTGQVPFPEESALLKLLAHRTQTRPSASRLRPEIPAGLDDLLHRAMARRPASRYQTPGRLAKALEAFADPAQRYPQRHGRKTLLTLAALILSLGAAIAGVMRLSTAKDQDVVIQTDDPEVEVVVKGDRIVRIVDPKTGKAYQLDRHDLTLALADDPDGLTVTLDGDKPIGLKRRGQTIATVRLEQARNHSPAKEPEQSGEVLRWSQGYKSVRRIAVSSDGRFAWTAGDSFSKWDLRTGERLKQIGSRSFAEEMLPSPDGKMLLLAEGDGGGAQLYDAATLKPLRSLVGSPASLMQAVWLPDDRLLTGGNDFIARLWDAQTGKVIRKFRGHTKNVDHVDVNRDGTRILTFSSEERTVRVWNPDDGKELWRLSGQAGLALFAPDGRSILIGDKLGVIRRVAYPSGTILRSFRSPGKQSVNWDRLCLLPDGRHFLSAGSDRVLRLWDLETGRELYHIDHPGQASAITVTPDGRHALLGTDFGSVLKWRLPPLRRGGEEAAEHSPQLKVPRLVEVRRHQLPLCEKNRIPPHAYTAAFPSDGTIYAVGGDDGLIRIWNCQTGQLLHTLRGRTGWIRRIAFTPDGKRLVSSDDQALRVWDTATGKERQQLPVPKGGAGLVDSAPDGIHLVANCFDNTVRIWNIETAREVRCVKVGEACEALFLADGRRVVTWNGTDTLKLWDAATGRLLATESGTPLSVKDVRATRGGKMLLVAGRDGLSWRDPATLREVRSLKRRGLFKDINWAVSPDGRFLIVADPNEAGARLWDLDAGKEVDCLELPTRPSMHLAFAPDGRHIAAGSFRGFVYLMRIEEGAAKARQED